MAPALSKADRQADCLPVVLSDPFCVSKSSAPFNRKDKIHVFNLEKAPSKVAALLSKRKPLMHKAWLRSCIKSGPLWSIRTPSDLHKSLLNGKDKTNAEGKTWHGTNVTLAVADKVRMKYTMNKNNTSVRNMGLARANTSLGIQSMKKKITHLSQSDKGCNSLQEQVERFTDSPDTINNDLGTVLPLEKLVPQCSEQQCEEVSSCTDLDACYPSHSESVSDTEFETLSFMLDEAVTKPEVLESCHSGPFVDLTSIPAARTSDQPLPVTLTEPDNALALADEAEVESSDTQYPSNLSSSLPSASNDATSVATSLETYSSPVSSPRTASPATQVENATYPNSDCDISTLPSAFDENGGSYFMTLPDSFLASSGKVTVSTDPVQSFVKDNVCCPVPAEDLSPLKDTLLTLEGRIYKALFQSEIILRRYVNTHTDRQMSKFVSHYQRKLSVPCQRQLRAGSSKQMKDLLDYKTELLKSQDVKNMSTAALVSLVRRLDSGSSANNSPEKLCLSEQPPREAILHNMDVADSLEVRQKSTILFDSMKTILERADPDLTESSEEECSDVEFQLSAPPEVVYQQRVLLNFLKERASLTSRSTWLIARIHELENQLRTVTGIHKKVTSSIQDIRFQEPQPGKESLQTTMKQVKAHDSLRPLNGCLHHQGTSDALLGLSNSLRLNDTKESCSRTRPLDISSFRKRKLLITTGLHLTSNKLAKLSLVSCECNCLKDSPPCVLCMGRYNCMQSVDPDTHLLDRVALLESDFHPLLSFDKDIPLSMHFESILKKNETQYHVERSPSPPPVQKMTTHYSGMRSRSRKFSRYARSLSEKYQKKKRHWRKHKIFGRWKRHQNKAYHTRERDRMRRLSVASSCSSYDSPILSPMSGFDDGSGFEKRRYDENNFDINDVIIPYSNKRRRLVKFEFKDIVIPNWRCRFLSETSPPEDDGVEENISTEELVIRHDRCEVEEKKITRKAATGAQGGSMQKRVSRHHYRGDSRADSSGANTPDPFMMFDNDNMFQDIQEMNMADSPFSPSMSPPHTPSSTLMASDDSQSAPCHSRASSLERKKLAAKRISEDLTRIPSTEMEEVVPFEPLVFPLPDITYDRMLAESEPLQEDTDVTLSGPSCPASPETSTANSTSTIDEDDPEWTVVKRAEGELIIKLAKR